MNVDLLNKIGLVLILIGFAMTSLWHRSALAKLKTYRTSLCERIIQHYHKLESLDFIEELQQELFRWICEYSTAVHPPFEEITRAYRLLTKEVNRLTCEEIKL
jgi:hypothetical protein